MTFEMKIREEREEAFSEGREVGHGEGREEGREEGSELLLIQMIEKKYKKGKNVDHIADEIEGDVSYVNEIIRIIDSLPDSEKSDPEKIFAAKHFVNS